MSDLQKLRTWVTKANALASVVVDAQGTVAEARVRQTLATKDGNSRAAEKYKGEYVYASRQQAMSLAMLYDATGVQSVAEASALLIDIRVACQAAYEAYEAWRKQRFLAGLATLAQMETASMMSTRGVELEDAYQIALAAAWALVPEDSELARLPL